MEKVCFPFLSVTFLSEVQVKTNLNLYKFDGFRSENYKPNQNIETTNIEKAQPKIGSLNRVTRQLKLESSLDLEHDQVNYCKVPIFGKHIKGNAK